MPRTVRRQRVSRGTNRRKFVWARCFKTGTVPAGDSLNYALLNQFESEYGADLIGATITRIRGTMVLFPAAETATVDTTLQVGIRVFTENVENPNPDVTSSGAEDEHSDWMYWKPVMLFSETFTDPYYAAARWEIDVRSQRKMEELGQGLLLSVHNPTTGLAFQHRSHLSIGLKLP